MVRKSLAAGIAAAALVVGLSLTGYGASQAQASPIAPAKTPITRTQTNKKSAKQTKAAPANNTSQTNSYIGIDAAKSAALSHAGLTEADVTNLKVELDTDDGTVHYDVDYKSGGLEYEYDIDAHNGNVLTYKTEIDD